MSKKLTIDDLRDFIGYCETHSLDGKVSASAIDGWLESKVPKHYGTAIFNGDEVVAFSRNDGVVFNIGDLVKTSRFGVRMAGTIKEIDKNGLILFKNAYPDGNDVNRWVIDIDHFDSSYGDVFVWLKS